MPDRAGNNGEAKQKSSKISNLPTHSPIKNRREGVSNLQNQATAIGVFVSICHGQCLNLKASKSPNNVFFTCPWAIAMSFSQVLEPLLFFWLFAIELISSHDAYSMTWQWHKANIAAIATSKRQEMLDGSSDTWCFHIFDMMYSVNIPTCWQPVKRWTPSCDLNPRIAGTSLMSVFSPHETGRWEFL